MFKIIKIFKFLLIFVITVVILNVILVFGFSIKSSNYKKADAIIIMGAAINSPALYNRSLEALNLYEQDLAPVMVLSGGRISDKDISEAMYMQKVMQSKSSKDLNVILEENSSNTYENINNSLINIPSAESVIIVTDKFHLARSVIMAKSAGFKEVFWQAPNTNFPKKELRKYYLREFFAMFAYLPKFVLQIYK